MLRGIFLKYITSYKTIAQNTFYLSLIEVVHFIIPFLALPYIIKTVGENYGKIVFAQAIVAYFAILVDFGVSTPAIKLVAENRSSKKRLRLISGSVFFLQILTLIISLLLFCVIVFSWPRARAEWSVFFASFMTCFANVLFCSWFFRGIENMKIIAMTRISSMLIYVIALFVFVHDKEQYALIPFLQSFASLLTSAAGFFYMCKYEKIIPVINVRSVRKRFKEAIPFFFTRCSVAINDSSATLAIGIFLGNYSVAVYDVARRIANAALIPYSMLSQVIYPHNARNKDAKFATYAWLVVAAVAFCGLIVLYYLIPFLVAFLGNNRFPDAVAISRFLEIHIILCVFTYYLGTPMLVAWGYPKPFNNSVIIATLCVLFLYGVLYVFSLNSIYYFASVCILSEAVLLFYRLFYCLKYKIIKL